MAFLGVSLNGCGDSCSCCDGRFPGNHVYSIFLTFAAAGPFGPVTTSNSTL
jgi:hypothetical protein